MVTKKISCLLIVLGFWSISISLLACTSPITGLKQINVPSQSRIQKVGNPSVGEGIYNLQFINEREGWLADSRRLWRTADGGVNWKLIYSISQAADLLDDIENIEFLNSQVGWIQRTRSGIYK